MSAQIKERPILMSAPMVKAILEGRKTMTRRIKSQPTNKVITQVKGSLWASEDIDVELITCPYGQVGDRLWCKETFVLEDDSEYQYENYNPLLTDRPIKTMPSEDEFSSSHLIPHYRATEPDVLITDGENGKGELKTVWSPSIFMPRWASRIILEITALRAERVQKITEEDAIQEGLGNQEPIAQFSCLWDKLYAKRGYSWASNPWVWVISFTIRERRGKWRVKSCGNGADSASKRLVN